MQIIIGLIIALAMLALGIVAIMALGGTLLVGIWSFFTGDYYANKIAEINIGMTKEQVISTMGTNYTTENREGEDSGIDVPSIRHKEYDLIWSGFSGTYFVRFDSTDHSTLKMKLKVYHRRE